MPLDLTSVHARVNNIKRNLFYDNTSVLRLLNLNDVLIEISSGWYIQKETTSNLATGAEYFEGTIVDESGQLGDLEPYLELTTELQVVTSTSTERYKITQYTRPRHLSKKWLLRLESTGNRT